MIKSERRSERVVVGVGGWVGGGGMGEGRALLTAI
jgi:hypothetical protein